MSRPPDLLHLYRDYRNHIDVTPLSVATTDVECGVNENDLPPTDEQIQEQNQRQMLNQELVSFTFFVHTHSSNKSFN